VNWLLYNDTCYQNNVEVKKIPLRLLRNSNDECSNVVPKVMCAGLTLVWNIVGCSKSQHLGRLWLPSFFTE